MNTVGTPEGSLALEDVAVRATRVARRIRRLRSLRAAWALSAVAALLGPLHAAVAATSPGTATAPPETPATSAAAPASTGATSSADPVRPQTLRQALEALRREGLPLVFSSSLVPVDLELVPASTATHGPGKKSTAAGRQIESDANADPLRARAEALLAPHGLALEPGPDGTLLVVRAAPRGTSRGRVSLAGEAPPDTLAVAETLLGEINVTASYGIDRSEPVATGALSSEEVLSLPRLGNDLLRGMIAVPGVTGNDTTAQFYVRGGLYRDTAIFLDGLELYEPYHLKDFQDGVFSIVDPDVIGSLDLIPGGFPAEYGDKMAGILDMRTSVPPSGFHGHVGASISTVWGTGSGTLGPEDRTGWLFSARRGFIDLIDADEASETETRTADGPTYWDVIGKIERTFSPSNVLTVSALLSDDSLVEEETELDDFGDTERDTTESEYGSKYVWLNHRGVLGEKLFVNTVLSGGRVDDDRRATEASFGLMAAIRDIREMDVFVLRQDWSAQVSDKHFLKWGAEVRSYDAFYDYTNVLAIDGALARQGLTRFRDSFSSETYSANVADRFRIGDSLVLEVGARYDRQELTDEEETSPRFNLVYDLGRAGALRASWGRYYQSQRPNELQVEDGESRFFPAERADAVLLGWERSFGRFNLRLDAYDRDIESPRPYYINLFEQTAPNPETTRDRLMIAPERASALGGELFVTRRGGKRFNWWANYAWSEVTDRIDGRDVPRIYDQTHAVSLSGTYRFGPKWALTSVFYFHTGWPTTEVSGKAVPGPSGELEIEPVLGELNGARLADYHRMDIRASRFVEFRSGNSLELYIDIQNLYARDNVAGFQVDERNFTLLPSGEVLYEPVIEKWLFGPLPSFGIGFRF